jgi:uncharacterized protein YjeT (DUF2065 family)
METPSRAGRLAPVTLEFLTVALVAAVIGIVFAVFPRQVSQGIGELFNRALRKGQPLAESRALGPIRAVGLILLSVGVLLIVFAIFGSYPRT